MNNELCTAILRCTSTLYFPQDAREHLYRTGQVSYADRDFKFV